MKESERRVAEAVKAAGPELAESIGEIVYWSLMQPENAKPSPVQEAIRRGIARAMETGAAWGNDIAQTRTTVRIAASMRIVGCVLTGKADRIPSIWQTANGWVESKDEVA